jgi:hypothetical protein
LKLEAVPSSETLVEIYYETTLKTAILIVIAVTNSVLAVALRTRMQGGELTVLDMALQESYLI